MVLVNQDSFTMVVRFITFLQIHNFPFRCRGLYKIQLPNMRRSSSFYLEQS